MRIRDHLASCKGRENNQKGFSLVEVLVAILIGLIVMGMAVAILGVTNSVSIRVLAKSEAQQNVRNSVVKLLDNLSNANSIETCRVAKTKDDQTALASGTLGNFDAAKCKEFRKTGYIVAYATPNRVCYFDKDVQNVNSFPDMRCITRGGFAAAILSQATILPGNGIMNFSACAEHQPNPTDSDRDLIYMFTCTPNGSPSRSRWPTGFSALAASESVIADIGLDDGASTASGPLNAIFSYIDEDFHGTNSVPVGDLQKLVAVKVSFEARYKNGRPSEVSKFNFNQTIILKESNKATEEEYDV